VGASVVTDANLYPFHRINFGLAAAETEKERSPELLLGGFLDAQGYVEKIQDGERFLLLGRKGSGKSAISGRIQLLAEDLPDLLSTEWTLTDFPFNAFAEILRGEETPEVRFAANWEFLLLVALMNSFRSDAGAKAAGSPSLPETLEALEKLAMIPGKDLTALVKQTSKREFKLGIPEIAQFRSGTNRQDVSPDLPALVRLLFATLQDVCFRTRTSKRHLIFIDGLDDVQTKRDIQYSALAALVVAVDRLNRNLRKYGVKAKIVLLCRSDLFNRLVGPNLNKIFQDSALSLNWYNDTRDRRNTDLVALINHRAGASLGRVVDVFDEFLPSTVKGQPTITFLMEDTRHNPRDIIQLFNRIQKHTKRACATEQEVLNACRDYSESYFRDEIQNEVSRLPESEGTLKTIRAISMLGKREFDIEDLSGMMAADERFKGVNPRLALEQLFDCSAVGNIRRGAFDQHDRFVFKYRNLSADFNPNDSVLVHNGLLKALVLA
jgi:ABC-type dipeptide/oligopeptide/nickel transport system ATPase component